MKTHILITAISSVFLAGGCGEIDGVVTRHVIVEEGVAFPAKPPYMESIEVDTSQLPPGSVVQRVDSKDRYGDPITTIKLLSHTALK